MRMILLSLAVMVPLLCWGAAQKGKSDQSVPPTVDWRHATFTDQDGDAVEISNLIGKPIILSFVFSCCKAYCPAQMSDLAFLQKTLDKEFGSANYRLLTVSMAPKFDTPEKLKAFADRYGADYENWYVVVGDKSTTDAMIKEAGANLIDFSTEDCADFNHSTDLYIIDRNGQFHSKVPGIPLDDAEVVSHIKRMNEGDPAVK